MLALSILALAPGAALGEVQWRTPQNLASDSYAPEVAVSPQGTAVAVWVGWDGVNTRIQASARPKGGAWGAPVFIGGANQNTELPHVAMDAQGNAVAVWSIHLANDRIQAAYRPAGDATSFSSPQTISAGGAFAYDSAVSMDDQGNAHAIWARGPYIESAMRPAGAGSSFGAVSTLSTNGGSVNSFEPQVAAEPNGKAVAVWTRFDGTDAFVQYSERKEPRYQEPQSASSLRVALVPVFRQCGTGTTPPTGSHPAPLATGSCVPGTTPGAVAHVGSSGVGSAQLTVIPGDFSTAVNEADFSIQVSATDIHAGSVSGSDYTPNAGGPDVTYNARLRITDSNNGPIAIDAATSTDLDFPVSVDCAATTGPTGSTCAINTTANAVSPGVVREGEDMIVQIFRVRLSDAGANGVLGDSDDKLFEQQGLLVP